MSTNAQLNDFICLKNPPRAPLERWQMLPTRPRTGVRSAIESVGSSPLRVRTSNVSLSSKTPDRHKLVIKYKKSPKIRSPKTPKHVTSTSLHYKSPGNSKRKTPKAKSGKKKTPGRSPSGCRFIPNRATMDLDLSAYLLRKERKEEQVDEEDEVTSPGTQEYQHTLLKVISRSKGKSTQKGVLSFNVTTPSIGEGSSFNYTANMTNSLSSVSIRSSHKKRMRRLPTTAEKVLDAPGLVDDYYLNTLDWGKNNVLAIGLANSVFLWNANDGSVCELPNIGTEFDYVSSVSWGGNGKYLAVGTSDSTIQVRTEERGESRTTARCASAISTEWVEWTERSGSDCIAITKSPTHFAIYLWDTTKERRLRVMRSHKDRVGVLTWNAHMLTSGSQDGEIHNHDVRIPKHCTSQFNHHQLEVCGLKWSPDGRCLASGSNDNLVCVWNTGLRETEPTVLTGHQSAVKAVSWCPWKSSLLATGGGSNDRSIKLWNVSNGKCLESVDTKSQVSGLSWNRESREIISSHGDPKNQLTIWKYPSMCKVGDILGHNRRILQMNLSPKRSSVATISADETLRIWKCFEQAKPTDSSLSYTEDSITALIRSVP